MIVTDGMVEKGAAAIWLVTALNDSGTRDLYREWTEMTDYDKETYSAQSRAALEAILPAALAAEREKERGRVTFKVGEMRDAYLAHNKQGTAPFDAALRQIVTETFNAVIAAIRALGDEK